MMITINLSKKYIDVSVCKNVWKPLECMSFFRWYFSVEHKFN